MTCIICELGLILHCALGVPVLLKAIKGQISWECPGCGVECFSVIVVLA